MNKILCFLAFFLNVCWGIHTILAQEIPGLRYADQVRLKEAFQIAELYADSVWEGFSQTPFVVLLVTDSLEFLVNHPYPSDDFTLGGTDSLLGTAVYYRPQQFNKAFLATFPAVNGVNCAVIGTPENTQLHSTQWVITLLHEHFHQYQFTSPGYFQALDSLGLANGDKSGMWQLNYPFPYEESQVVKKYEAYTRQLKQTVEALDSPNWAKSYSKFLRKRKAFQKALSKKDYRYLSFQWYQEGVARYTEYRFLELLQEYEPGEEAKNLKDFMPYPEYREKFFRQHLDRVVEFKLPKHKRETAYDVGFAEALLIRKVNPAWGKYYLSDKFDLLKFHLE